MFEIQQNSLNKLKCVECEGYLSCSPVYLKTDGGSICGRCPAPEKEEGIRNTPYEELASLVAFPCRHLEYGCQDKVPFRQLKQHENSCKHRPLICPVAQSGRCDWVKPCYKLLKHCQEKHPEQVLQHPAVLEHDIRKNNLFSYVMYIYQVLFLVQTKVCITSGNICHSVRLLGDSQRAADFSYYLVIKNSGGMLKKQKSVAPQGCLALQEDTSIVTNINILLGALGTFDGTTFTIFINKLVQDCVKCGKSLARNVYQNSEERGHCVNCSTFITRQTASTPNNQLTSQPIADIHSQINSTTITTTITTTSTNTTTTNTTTSQSSSTSNGQTSSVPTSGVTSQSTCSTASSQTAFSLSFDTSGQSTSQSDNQQSSSACNSRATNTATDQSTSTSEMVLCKKSWQGCTYIDIQRKMKKHALYYCEYSTKCQICGFSVIDAILEEHRREKHFRITHSFRSDWNAIPRTTKQWRIITASAGELLCCYFFTTSGFRFLVHSPLRSEELDKYNCILLLIHPVTRGYIRRILDVTYENEWDWFTDIDNELVRSLLHVGQCVIRFDIIKKDSL